MQLQTLKALKEPLSFYYVRHSWFVRNNNPLVTLKTSLFSRFSKRINKADLRPHLCDAQTMDMPYFEGEYRVKPTQICRSGYANRPDPILCLMVNGLSLSMTKRLIRTLRELDRQGLLSNADPNQIYSRASGT